MTEALQLNIQASGPGLLAQAAYRPGARTYLRYQLRRAALLRYPSTDTRKPLRASGARPSSYASCSAEAILS